MDILHKVFKNVYFESSLYSTPKGFIRTYTHYTNEKKEGDWKKTTERRKEMFYLTMNSIHFYLQLYGVRYMIKDHSDSRENTRCRQIGYSF